MFSLVRYSLIWRNCLSNTWLQLLTYICLATIHQTKKIVLNEAQTDKQKKLMWINMIVFSYLDWSLYIFSAFVIKRACWNYDNAFEMMSGSFCRRGSELNHKFSLFTRAVFSLSLAFPLSLSLWPTWAMRMISWNRFYVGFLWFLKNAYTINEISSHDHHSRRLIKRIFIQI